jgi:hypothetical protein
LTSTRRLSLSLSLSLTLYNFYFFPFAELLLLYGGAERYSWASTPPLSTPPHFLLALLFVIVGIFIGRICVTRTIAIYSSVFLPWNAGMSAAALKSFFNFFSQLVLKMIVLFLSPAVQRVHDNKTADFSMYIYRDESSSWKTGTRAVVSGQIVEKEV